jgi:hypothetical protein
MPLTTLPEQVWAELILNIQHAHPRYEAPYWIGVSAGFTAATSDHDFWPKRIARAANVRFAQPVPYGQAVTLVGMLPPHTVDRMGLFDACGVLWGWKEATEGIPGVAVCACCDRRVMPDQAGSIWCDNHGAFCDQDCARDVCLPTLCQLEAWSIR